MHAGKKFNGEKGRKRTPLSPHPRHRALARRSLLPLSVRHLLLCYIMWPLPWMRAKGLENGGDSALMFDAWIPGAQSPRGCELLVIQEETKTRVRGTLYARNQVRGVANLRPICVQLDCPDFLIVPRMRCQANATATGLGVFLVLADPQSAHETLPWVPFVTILIIVVVSSALWRLAASWVQRAARRQGKRKAVPLDVWEWRVHLEQND